MGGVIVTFLEFGVWNLEFGVLEQSYLRNTIFRLEEYGSSVTAFHFHIFTFSHFHICKGCLSQSKLSPDLIIIGTPGSKACVSFIIHNKKITTVKMPVHFPDLFLINYV